MSAASGLAILKSIAFLTFQFLSLFWIFAMFIGGSIGMRDSFCYSFHLDNVLILLLSIFLSFIPCMALNSVFIYKRYTESRLQLLYALLPIFFVFASTIFILVAESLSYVVSREHCNSAEYPKGLENMDDNAPTHWLSLPLMWAALASLCLYFVSSVLLFWGRRFIK